MIVNYDHKTFIVQATGYWFLTNVRLIGTVEQRLHHVGRQLGLVLAPQSVNFVSGKRLVVVKGCGIRRQKFRQKGRPASPRRHLRSTL
jgi:hypothetical protein